MIDRALNQNFVPVVDDRKMFIGIITSKRYYQILLWKRERQEKSPSLPSLWRRMAKKETEQIEQV